MALNDEVNNDNFDKKDIKPVEKENDSAGSNSEGKDRFNTYIYVWEGIFNKILLSEIGLHIFNKFPQFLPLFVTKV